MLSEYEFEDLDLDEKIEYLASGETPDREEEEDYEKVDPDEDFWDDWESEND